MFRRPRNVPILLALLVSAAAPAQTVWVNPYNGNQFGNLYGAQADVIMSQMIQNAGWQSLRASIENHAAAGGRGSAARQRTDAPAQADAEPIVATLPARPAHPITASDFRPTARRTVAREWAAAVGGGDAQARAAAEAELAALIPAIEQVPGFRPHNLAYAMTVALGLALETARGIRLDDDQSERLARGLNDLLVESGALATLDAETRTRAYDTFLLMGGLIASASQHAADGDRAQAALARELARATLAAFGVGAH